MKTQKFHSGFMIDVSIDKEKITLVDSARNRWFIDVSEKNVVEQFRIWFKTTFAKGLPQTPTVFEYEDRSENEADIECYVVKFLGVKSEERTLNETGVEN